MTMNIFVNTINAIIAGLILLVVIRLFIKRKRDRKPIIRNGCGVIRIEPGERRRIVLSDGKIIEIKAIDDNYVETPEQGFCSICVLREDSACINVLCTPTRNRVGVHFVKIK